MTTTPIVALQKPKDISLDEIEAELRNIWRNQDTGSTAPVATRASTFSLVVYEPEEIQQLLAALGLYSGAIDGMHGSQTRDAIRQAQIKYDLRVTGRVGPRTLERLREEYAKLPPEQRQFTNMDIRGFTLNDAIAAQNPCRVITLSPILGEDTGVTAQVSAYCPVQKRNASNLICCEYITLRGTKAALDRVAELVSSLVIGDLPKFVWWRATPNPEQALFQKLARSSNCIIVDSSFFSDAESELRKMQDLVEDGTFIADLNWHRLAPWQELTAAAFDPPERRESLNDVDQVSIDYEQGNAAQAFMYLGWLAGRLEWQPKSYVKEGGDYDIRKIMFTNPSGREIEAELAAIPVADWGEIVGDLTGLRVTSTNPDANCCTILCSETTGCMRMEAGGGAQSCQVEQVTALSDQKADFMLGQQLQRWGEDVLYEESLAATTQILHLL
ncbi:glucose-6-phosphate dehydrogenase assembly protein OpcA [Pseudanabaena sp. FACHB-2040]|uniref:glucose-6-phosphate dehydrogenase assembly protein OpcA n=1 Tax=Pseudanabaena sp. FACHB-2040 TaxID=2692859 RepID=UPI0016859254|nr:glucose-6-phosphate dehydrogenase assembly protein OpcA [Pseudanabaena sp. FACHB-2040]MBD2258935.1 glucose-6-phosphate dehydrogenase assembly protein OpcA [Pseudanabaena sp. FACHB-2040]